MHRLLRKLLRREPAPVAPPPAPAWMRADLLRLLHRLEGEEPALESVEIMEMELFQPTRYHRALLHSLAQEDWHLFCAVRDACSEFRERQYQALERLALLMSLEPGSDVEQRMAAALAHNPGPVAGCLLELDWLREEPLGY